MIAFRRLASGPGLKLGKPVDPNAAKPFNEGVINGPPPASRGIYTLNMGTQTLNINEGQDASANPTEFEKFCEGKEETEITQMGIASPNQSFANAEKLLLENTINSRVRETWTQQDWENQQQQATDLFNLVALAMNSKHKPEAAPVQDLLRQHYNLSKQFYNMSPEVYVAMAQLFREHPGFRIQLESVDPLLADFMAEAMVCFANNPQ